MNKAYRAYVEDSKETPVPFDKWKEERETSPLFHYWSLTLKFELTILIFVRSIREGNFELYKDSLSILIPWFFALDHPNYARWLPVHLRDMMTLHSTAPDIFTEFEKGHFVVHKTHNTFSGIAIDHAHEQNNKLVNGNGGAVGLTEDASQLLRWMVSGPEMARAVNEFESFLELIQCQQNKNSNVKHHEQTKSVQKSFVNHVKSLVDVICKMGNPFLEH